MADDETPVFHAKLANFLIKLAIDEGVRARFTENAEQEMEAHELETDERDALRSRNEESIEKLVGFGGQHH